MLVSEVFYSLQGEGRLAGTPSVFIRLSGCNLRCAWCDTPYASWDPSGDERSVDSLIDQALAYPSRHAVLTGGEPMAAAEIHQLAHGLGASGFHITIETAATIPPKHITCDLASLSPKLSHSTPAPGTIAPGWIQRHESRRLQPSVVRAWMDDFDYQLKFVVASRRDVHEIEDLLQRLGHPPPHRIQIMPEGTTPEALDRAATWIAHLCLEKGWRFCDRLHLRLYGNTPGT